MSENQNPEAATPEEEKPSWSKPCAGCNATVERWPGQGDVSCRTESCTVSYNAFGQRLSNAWRENPSWGDEDISDMDGYEQAALVRESARERQP